MPADVRINEVTTDINVTDAAAMLTPAVLERIVQAALARLKEQQRLEREIEQERGVGNRNGE
jgi:hypothetical protein